MRNKDESIGGLMVLKLFIRKLRRVLLHPPSKGPENLCDCEEVEAEEIAPEDVTKGCFAVTTAKGGEPKRFVVELDYLTNPEFLALLEQAKEEYGFQQRGVLAVPCRPEELEKILDNRRWRRASTEW